MLKCVFACLLTFAGLANAQINVTGTGSVTVKPDMATFSVVVSSSDATALKAVQETAKKVKLVYKALQDANIDSRDYQTLSFQCYQETNEKTNAVKYNAVNTINIKVCDLTKVESVLDSVIQAGGTLSGRLTWDLKDKDELLSNARKAAVADAKSKAKLYAASAKVTLGELKSLTEHESYGRDVHPYHDGGALRNNITTPIAPGEITLRVNISTTWGIEGLPQ